ncbi:hypothetical protein ACLB2K_011754 [Fragaria x ananassa]
MVELAGGCGQSMSIRSRQWKKSTRCRQINLQSTVNDVDSPSTVDENIALTTDLNRASSSQPTINDGVEPKIDPTSV